MENAYVHVYSRKQAISDGVLLDLSELAREAGFRWPLAVTSRLYYEYLVPSLDLASDGQSLTGRAWDLLNVLKYTIREAKDETFLRFSVLFLMSRCSTPIPIELISIAGPGDDGEPVLTVLLPDED
jgi:hypothetical protein